MTLGQKLRPKVIAKSKNTQITSTLYSSRLHPLEGRYSQHFAMTSKRQSQQIEFAQNLERRDQIIDFIT